MVRNISVNGTSVRSNKQVAKITTSQVIFADDSWCNVKTGEVYNNGAGYIQVDMKGGGGSTLLAAFVASGLALLAAIMTSAMLKSHRAWAFTWVACIGWGVVVLIVGLIVVLVRGTERAEEQVRQRLNGIS